MKKAVVDFAAGGLRTAPQVADNAFNWRVFEANAQAYLFKQITAEVFAEACGEALNSPLAVPYGHTIYKYRYLALMEQGRYYEAFLDAQVIGTTMIGYDGHRGWIYYVAVAPERRGRGIAREMIQVAEDWLADRGAPKVQLMVRGDTLDVADYYRRLGYEDSDCVVLGKRLG